MATLRGARRKELPASAFAYPERRLLPIVDAAHVRAALGRFASTQFPDMATARRAAGRILRAAKKLGISVSPASGVAKVASQVKPAARPKRRRNPSTPRRAPKAGGDRKLLEKARDLSRRFHGSAGEVLELSPEERRPLPRFVVLAGSLEDFTYKAKASSPRRKGTPWRHETGDHGPLRPRSKDKPLLVVDPETGKPAILPARSRIKLTDRGFEG